MASGVLTPSYYRRTEQDVIVARAALAGLSDQD
jgi:hypothetical protein